MVSRLQNTLRPVVVVFGRGISMIVPEFDITMRDDGSFVCERSRA